MRQGRKTQNRPSRPIDAVTVLQSVARVADGGQPIKLVEPIVTRVLCKNVNLFELVEAFPGYPGRSLTMADILMALVALLFSGYQRRFRS